MPMKTKEEQREYQRLWMQRRRQEGIESLGGKCVDCETTENLEVDHVDASTKLYAPAALWGMSVTNPKRIAELAKCVVRCEECHAKKTSNKKEHPRGIQKTETVIFTETQIREIRARYVPRVVSIAQLAKEYGASKNAVASILSRNTWKHIV